MRFRFFPLILLAAGILCSCSRAVEPGLYKARTDSGDGFVRITVDSLDHETALFFRDTGHLTADSVSVSLKQEKGKYRMTFPDGSSELVSLSLYDTLTFHQFTVNDLYLVPQYKVGETKNIVFGRVLRGQGGGKEYSDLLMDLYYPENDDSEARPLLLTFHDGAFEEGDKRDSSIVEWNRYFASLGYVVSSVNYRLGYRRNQEETDEAMFHALKDANAAVRFLLKKDTLMVHSGRIFAAGADAGAITALNLAYFREENFPEIKKEVGDSVRTVRTKLVRGFDIRAVANLWGAVPDTAILENAKVPVISFHDRNDSVIPFGEGYPFDGPVEKEINIFRSFLEELLSWFMPEEHPFRKMYGSGVIDRILKKRGVQTELYAYEEGLHDLSVSQDGLPDYPRFDDIKEKVARFFATKMETSPVSLRQDSEDEQLFLIDKSEVDVCEWYVEGGVILGKSEDTVRILLFPDADERSVSVSGLYTSGLSFFEKLAL